jgi:hypothetical protein
MIKIKAKLSRLMMTMAMAAVVTPLSADPILCGGTNYNQGINALMGMTSFVTTMMTCTMSITTAVAGIVSLIGALNIYIKMNTGQEGITKSIVMLVGGVLFMIAATITMPAFFGFSYASGYVPGLAWWR